MSTLPVAYTADELSAEAIEVSLSVMRDATRRGRSAAQVRLSAAREILAHARWLQEREGSGIDALVQLLGSEEDTVRWIETVLPSLRDRISRRKGLLCASSPERCLLPQAP